MTPRRGITAVLAMMYLALFSVLALGFFATVTTSAQIAGNDKRGIDARLAAESGMQFMKYHLAEMDIPRFTSEAGLMDAVYTALSDRLDGTTNMRGQVVEMAGNKVYVPGPDDTYISVDGGTQEFRATIEKFGKYGLRVTTVGRAHGITTNDLRGARGVQLDYSNTLEPGTVFSYGVASTGTVTMQGSVVVTGPVGNKPLANMLSLSTALNPISLPAGATLSGDISMLGGIPIVGPTSKVGDVSPLDPSFSSHIQTIAEPPEFPAVDTSDFVAFAPPQGSVGPGVLNSALPPAGTYRNIRIPAGLNPSFNGPTVIEGVVVIEYPNQVQFGGGTTIKGTIVSECIPSDQNHEARIQADLADNGVIDNWIRFGGSVTSVGMDTLDPTIFTEAQRSLTGSLILAPGFKGVFLGNYSAGIGGAIVCSAQEWGGNSGGRLNASIISLSDVPMIIRGNQTLTIEGHGFGNPAGLRFTSHYSPLIYSYREVRPQ